MAHLTSGVRSFLVVALIVSLTACANRSSETATLVATTEDYAVARSALGERDYETAFRIFKSLADRKDAKAAYQIAGMYEFGRGSKQDYAKSYEYYRQAAHYGQAEAQFKIAQLFEGRNGVQRNLLKSLTWYKIALMNSELSSRSRYWADLYVRSFFSVHAFDKKWARDTFEQATVAAEEWEPVQG